MSDEWIICKWCGGECFEFEMHDKEKCKHCFVQDCFHKETMRDYQGSTHNRARFLETCITCEAFREMVFYFPTRTKGHMFTCEDWDHEEVSLE